MKPDTDNIIPLPIKQPMRVLQGLGVAGGIAFGVVCRRESQAFDVPTYTIDANDSDVECARLHLAAAKARQELHHLKAKSDGLSASALEEAHYLIDVHVQMLGRSRLIRGIEQRINAQLLNAEAALQAEIDAIIHEFDAMDDAYLAARSDDVRAVGKRLMRHLIRDTKATATPRFALPPEAILVSDDISPADTAFFDITRLHGIVLENGGPESHTAILARSIGIPAVVGVHEALTSLHDGDSVIIDGHKGLVIIHADAATLAAYRQQRQAADAQRQKLAGMRSLPAVTMDGVPVTLWSNIELPNEIATAHDVGSHGIGLLRTEFLFLNRDELPNEDEQFAILKSIVLAMKGAPVTIRTIDLGGDKLIKHSYFAEHVHPALHSKHNAVLGLRSIRLSLAYPDVLRQQLCAILRAQYYGAVRVLLPLVTTVDEVKAVKNLMLEARDLLTHRGEPLAEHLPELGIVVEVPATAIAADIFAPEVDFFSIGTNDLTMYTLAVDRADEHMAHLYDPLHPAVLRLIDFTIKAANRHGKPVCLCGEMASDPRLTRLLLGLGLTELSMSPITIPQVKQRLRACSMADMRQNAQLFLQRYTGHDVFGLLTSCNL